MKITIEPRQTPNIWHFSAAPELRIYAQRDFETDNGETVLRGTVGTDEPHLKIPCTLDGTVLEIPAVEIDSTPLDQPEVRYTAILKLGSRRVPYLSNFRVPAEPAGTNWHDLKIYQRIGNMRFVNPPIAELQQMVAGMISNALTFRRHGSTTQDGMVALTTPPVDATFPIAVSATDPRLQQLQSGSLDVTQAPYSVLNNGTPQSTAGLQAALDAARDSNGQYTAVSLPAGRYNFNSGSLTIHQGLALIGTWKGRHSHQSAAFAGLPDIQDGKGTTIEITADEGTATGAFIFMESNTVLSGIAFYYPNQSRTNVTPTFYPWTVQLGIHPNHGWGSHTIENCEFLNAYQAIRCRYTARFVIRNIGGQPIFGIDIDKCFDTSFVENVLFNAFDWSTPIAGSPTNNYYKYQNINGVGIKIGRADNLIIHNSYFLGYHKGMETVKTTAEGILDGGTAWVTVHGGGFEHCTFGAYLNYGNQIQLNNMLIGGAVDESGAGLGFSVYTAPTFATRTAGLEMGILKIHGGIMGGHAGSITTLTDILLEGSGRVQIDGVFFYDAALHNIYANSPGPVGTGDMALSIQNNHFNQSVLQAISINGYVTCNISANTFMVKSSANAIVAATQTGYNVTIQPSNRFGGDNVVPFGKPSLLLGKLFPEADAIEFYCNTTVTARDGGQGSATLKGFNSGGVGFGTMAVNAAFNGVNWLRQNDAFDSWLIQGGSTTTQTGALIIFHAPPGAGAIAWTQVFTVGADNKVFFPLKTKAGAPVDGDFPVAVDGLSTLDTANHRLYYRSGGTWKFTQLA